MNFVGHIHIASQCLVRHGYPSLTPSSETVLSPTVRYHLGTALPDFAAIGRFQLQNEPQDQLVQTGIAMHHATDGAFHGNDWFIDQSKALGADLRSRDVNRGAARACGHVGIELLLDGNLIERDTTLAGRAQDVLYAANDPHLLLTQLVEQSRTGSWSTHLERIGSWSLPTDYDQPAAVAERLYRILSHRPRLAFERDQIPTVADALARASESLVPGIENMVQAVVDEAATELAGVS